MDKEPKMNQSVAPPGKGKSRLLEMLEEYLQDPENKERVAAQLQELIAGASGSGPVIGDFIVQQQFAMAYPEGNVKMELAPDFIVKEAKHTDWRMETVSVLGYDFFVLHEDGNVYIPSDQRDEFLHALTVMPTEDDIAWAKQLITELENK